MKKYIILLLIIIAIPICLSFDYSTTSTSTVDEILEEDGQKIFSMDLLGTSEKEFKSEPVQTCGIGSVKSYMDYRAITDPASKQYRYIQEHMTVDEETGFLYDEDGFIGAALGSYYGVIGDRFYFTFENDVTIPIVKIESKANIDTDDANCYNPNDNSVIEFVIDRYIADAYFGEYGNGLVLSGNYGNYPLFKGSIIKVEKVLEEEPKDTSIAYKSNQENTNEDPNIFYYASGY